MCCCPARASRGIIPRLPQRGDVDVAPLYETRPASDEQRAHIRGLLEAQAIDAVLLLSGSMVDSLVDVLGPTAKARLEGVALASIGPVTTQAAERHGLTVAITASDATIESLLDGLASPIGS